MAFSLYEGEGGGGVCLRRAFTRNTTLFHPAGPELHLRPTGESLSLSFPPAGGGTGHASPLLTGEEGEGCSTAVGTRKGGLTDGGCCGTMER